MADYDTITLYIGDKDVDTRFHPFPFRVPTGQTIAQIQNITDNLIPLVENTSEGYIDHATVELNLDIDARVRTAALTGASNERGGLVSMSTSGPRNSSFRVPAITHTIMPGETPNTGDTNLAALIDAFTNGVNNGTTDVAPLTDQGYAFLAAIGSKRSQWRK